MKHTLFITRFILMLTLLGVLGVISASAQEPSPTPQIELLIGLPPSYTELRDVVHEQIAQFEAETGIKVVIDDDYGGPTYTDRVESMWYVYDIFYVPQRDYLERWVNRLLPLDGMITDEADFYPIVLDSARVNGRLHCIPEGTITHNLFYNRDSFDKAGLEYPTDDWTWDDLREASQSLVDANSEPFILDDTLDTWLPFLYQAGSTLTDSQTGAWAFNTPQGLESLNIYFDLYQMGRNASEIDGWSGSEFLDNRAGMIMQASWMIALIINDSPINWGAVTLPSQHTEATITYFSGCYGVSLETKNLQASLLLANFLTNTESQTEFFSSGALPSRMSLEESYINHWVNRATEKGLVWHREDIQTFFDSLQHSFPLPIVRVGDYTYPLHDVFRSAFPQVLNNEITAQDMLNQLDAVIITNSP